MTGEDLDVLVLTYNRSRYLKIQLEGLCEQTLKGFRIIVLNNCSTDDTLLVIEEVKNKYPERDIDVVINEKNLGTLTDLIHYRKGSTLLFFMMMMQYIQSISKQR